MANISQTTINQLNELYSFDFYDQIGCNPVTPDKADRIYIGFNKSTKTNDFVDYIGKNIKLPTKKETTLEYILEKINSESIFKNFTEHFKTLIKKYDLSAYPTTYGIGIFSLFNFNNQVTDAKQNVESILNDLGVEYTTEYSDAGWVFRYKISKAANNIERIKQICSK